MTTHSQKPSIDLLGIKPFGEAIRNLTDTMITGAAAFLSRICLPAAEEYGLLLRDRVQSWRAANLAAIAKKAELNLAAESSLCELHAHPRIVSKILDEGSWTDDVIVQDMWAGLLSSACTEDGDDDSNLIFINLLAGMTKLQARILKHSCEHSQKRLLANGLVASAGGVKVELNELRRIADEQDVHRLDYELDYLRELGLLAPLSSGFDPTIQVLYADLGVTALALQLFVRCQGSRLNPVDFYGLATPSPEPA